MCLSSRFHSPNKTFWTFSYHHIQEFTPLYCTVFEETDSSIIFYWLVGRVFLQTQLTFYLTLVYFFGINAYVWQKQRQRLTTPRAHWRRLNYPSSNNNSQAILSTLLPMLQVRIVESQVPNDQYLYEAVGMLQVALEMEDDFSKAFPRFLRAFQANHRNQEWKLAGGCSLMLLSNQTTFIQLEEVLSHTVVNIFVWICWINSIKVKDS